MNSDITTSDELEEIIDSEHDLYKSEWDKKNVVQFKNERIAILENKFEKQVKFIVAFDQVLKEGYVLIGTADSQDSSGFASKSLGGGAASVMFYFQKAK